MYTYIPTYIFTYHRYTHTATCVYICIYTHTAMRGSRLILTNSNAVCVYICIYTHSIVVLKFDPRELISCVRELHTQTSCVNMYIHTNI
jgi:hypothetical protein